MCYLIVIILVTIFRELLNFDREHRCTNLLKICINSIMQNINRNQKIYHLVRMNAGNFSQHEAFA